MERSGRYLIFLAIVYLIEDTILLNLLFLFLLDTYHLNYGESYHLLLVLINLVYLLSFAVIRFEYNDVRELHMHNLIRRNFYKLTFMALIFIGSLSILNVLDMISVRFAFTFFFIAYFLMLLCHWVTRKTLSFFIKRTNIEAVILGAGFVGKKIDEEFRKNLYLGVRVLGFFDDDPDKNDGNILGSIEDAKEYIRYNQITRVYCTLPSSADEKIKDFTKFAEKNVIEFHVIPSVDYYYSENYTIVEYIGKMPVFAQRRIPLSYAHNAILKRAFDIVVSLIFLTTIFPFIFLVVGILIKLSSPGPIFFIQKRTGINGKTFNCFKFRSMKCNDDANRRQATINDDRKTPVGNFLRKSSIDELPQFINVLKGDMSIVGPRPHMLLHTEEYSPMVDKYMVRHFIQPGITGWAQVKGFRGETKDVGLMEKRICEDIRYIENWSLLLDVEIFFKTLFVMLKGDKKAY